MDMMTGTLADETPAAAPPKGWRRLGALRIGIIPLPIYALMVLVVAGLLAVDDIRTDILTNILILSLGGFTAAEIGRHLPLVRRIGAPAIVATFVPSYLVYAGILPMPVIASVTAFTKQSNFLYLFISAIIVGSILGMDRGMLVRGFLKIFVPLACGSVAAALAGTAMGMIVGIGAERAFFYIVVPIMAGGVGEGAIPLSIGYATLTGVEQGRVFTQILPSVMMGSLTAVLIAGTLNHVGRRYPALTGEGRLSPADVRFDPARAAAEPIATPLEHVAAAGLMAVTLYMIGELAHAVLHWPAPIVMLAIAVALKLARLVPPAFERSSAKVSRFFSIAVTYPLLFAIGVSMTPWEELIDAFRLDNIAVIVTTVATLIATGFLIARRIGMYPIDVAIVNACHSGQGGTGDVAILTAAERMPLMPFAQIATRIGGAITVLIALVAMHALR